MNRLILVATVALVLVGLFLGEFHLIVRQKAPGAVIRKIEQNLERELHTQDAILDFIADNIDGPGFRDSVGRHKHPIRIYQKDNLVFWNNDSYVPGDLSLTQSRDTLFVLDAGSVFVVIQRSMLSAQWGEIQCLAFLPLLEYNHAVHDSPQLNGEIFENFNIQIRGGTTPVAAWGREILKVGLDFPGTRKNSPLKHILEYGFIILFFLAAVLVWYKLHLGGRKRDEWVFLFALIAVRSVQMMFFPLEDKFQIPPFDLKITYSNFPILNSSTMGDAVINTAIFGSALYLGLISLFGLFRVNRFVLKNQNRNVKGLILYLLPCLFGLALVQLVYLFSEYSAVELDFTKSMEITSDKVFFYSLFLAVGFLYFLVNHHCYRYFSRLRIYGLRAVAIAGLAALVTLIFSSSNFGLVLAGCQGILWLVMAKNRDFVRWKDISAIPFAYHVTVWLFAGFYGTLGLVKGYQDRSEKYKDSYVKKIEYGEESVLLDHVEQVLREFNEAYPMKILFLSSNFKGKVEEVQIQIIDNIKSLPPLRVQEYQVRVYFFDREGVRILGKLSRDQGPSTPSIPKNGQEVRNNIFDLGNPEENIVRYRAISHVSHLGNPLGSVVFEFEREGNTAASNISNILTDRPAPSMRIDHCIIRGGKPVFKDCSPFFSQIYDDSPALESIAPGSGHSYIKGRHVYNETLKNGDKILVGIDPYGNGSILTNSAFFFLVFLLFISLYYVSSMLLRRVKRVGGIGNEFQLYRGIGFIMLTILISVVLLNVLDSSYREEIDRNYRKRVQASLENLSLQTSRFLEGRIDQVAFDSDLAKASALSRVEIIHLFDMEGRLLSTSEPGIFDRGFKGSYLDPWVLKRMKIQHGRPLFVPEKFGRLSYKTFYTGMFSPDPDEDRMIAVLASPYTGAKNHLRRQRIEIASNLLLLFTVLFVASMFLESWWFAKLISPITAVAMRLKNVDYSNVGSNPVKYSSRDEIGILVDEYNKMARNLELSKRELAKVQKEHAWNELAPQVSHEIKNLVTPMALKIQQMKRSVSLTPELSRLLESFHHQVGILSQISESFFHYSRMPAPANERTNVSELVLRTVQLFEDGQCRIDKIISPGVYIQVDTRVLSQILSNLILNAIQASPEGHEKPRLVVKLVQETRKTLLSVTDFGVGILQEHRDKIFNMYFSTKEEGRGIGLALARKGVEQAGGTIWFDSKMGEGTTFTMSFPSLDP